MDNNKPLDEIKNMFPDFHPEHYVMSVAACCGSCKKGKCMTFFVLCRGLEMFPYGICPQYERNTDIKYPLVVIGVNSQYGHGQG